MKVFKRLLIMVILGISTAVMQGQETDSDQRLISVTDMKILLQQKPEVLLLDVRTAQEYAEGHLPGARNIDFLSDDFQEKIEQLPKDQTVYLYCRSGNRSAKAAKVIDEIGFRRIYDIEGGYLEWKKQDQQE